MITKRALVLMSPMCIHSSHQDVRIVTALLGAVRRHLVAPSCGFMHLLNFSKGAQ